VLYSLRQSGEGEGGWGPIEFVALMLGVYEVTDPVLCSEALEMRKGITEDYCCMSYSYGCLQGVSFSFVSRGVL